MKRILFLPFVVLLFQCGTQTLPEKRASEEQHAPTVGERDPAISLRITFRSTSSMNDEADTLVFAWWKTFLVYEAWNEYQSTRSIRDLNGDSILVLVDSPEDGKMCFFNTVAARFKAFEKDTADLKGPAPVYTGKTKTIAGYTCRQYIIHDRDSNKITGWEAAALIRKGTTGGSASLDDVNGCLEMTIEAKHKTFHVMAIKIEMPFRHEEGYFSLTPPPAYGKPEDMFSSFGISTQH
jgi:hypothetical protein